MNALRQITYLSATLLTCLLVQPSADALPGKSLQESRASIRRSELFPGMELTQDNWGYAVSVSNNGNDGNDGIVLYVNEINGIVASEMLQIRYPEFSMAFERDNEVGLGLISSTWDDSVVEDFANARYIAAIESSLPGPPSRYYLGDRYGYIVGFNPQHDGNSGIHSLWVYNHADWEEAQRRARFCLNNPRHDNCSGL